MPIILLTHISQDINYEIKEIKKKSIFLMERPFSDPKKGKIYMGLCLNHPNEEFYHPNK